MLEGVHIVLHVLVVVVGVGEEVVVVRKDVGRCDVAFGQEYFAWLFDFEHLFGVVVDEASLLVAQVDRYVAVAFDADGVVDAH